jgi:hypothetical protein
MTTIHAATATVQFDVALTAAARRATTAHPHAATRIAKGLALVEADAVTDMRRIRPDWFTVRSASNPATVYDVYSRGHTVCTCPDYGRHAIDNTDYLCKHGWAVLLVRSLQRTVGHTRIVHAHHWYYGEGHARRLVGNRAVFQPGGHVRRFLCDLADLSLGPPVQPLGQAD